MTKPTKWLCAQRRLRSSWAPAQSDQGLRCALNGELRTQAFFMRTAKTLIRLGGCPGWSESSLGVTLLVLSCRGSDWHYCQSISLLTSLLLSFMFSASTNVSAIAFPLTSVCSGVHSVLNCTRWLSNINLSCSISEIVPLCAVHSYPSVIIPKANWLNKILLP